MWVPRKPHPFGNEYHSIADGDDGKPIMWRVKIVEGKDKPKRANGQPVFPSEFPGLGKTATTMLETMKPIHGKGKVVVGDSGFCVREGVVECHKGGVWFQVYVKKRGNWPRGVPGKVIALSPFSQTRDAARRVRMCRSESKKRFENGCGSKVVEFSLNENYEH
jgi:hypothetical protein